MIGYYPITLPNDTVVWLTPSDYAIYCGLLVQQFWGFV
jgi:hypothetical protein